MKKIKAILLSTISALGLASCSFQDAWTAVKDGTTGAFEKVKDVFVKDKGEENNEDEPKPCSHVDANTDHKCDLCGESMGEHKDLDGDGKCDYCSANIPSVVSVTIEEGERSVGVGQSIKLVAKVQAVGGASRSVTWKVDDSSKASIDSTGKLVGLQAGSVLVTATSSVDPTKSASVTVEVTEPGWSQASMDMMAEKLHGVTLPFFGASWSQPEYDEEDYVVSTSSKEGNLNEIKSLFEAAGFTVEETTFALTDTVSVDGLLASIDVGDTGYVEVQVADLNSYQRGAGVMVIAYYGEFVAWPAEMIAEFIGEHTEETVPQPEGKVTSAVLRETTYYDFVSIQMRSNAENYIQALTQAGWECEYDDDYECFDCISPEGYLEVIVYPFGSNSLQMNIFLVDPPAAEFPSEAVAEFVGEHSTDEIPTPEGTGFELGYTEYGNLYVDISNGDLSAYVQALTELGYVCEDLLDTKGYVDCVSPTSTLEIVLFDLTPYGYPEGSFEFQLMLIEPPAAEFPSEAVAEFVGEHSTDEIPTPEGTGFELGYTKYGDLYVDITNGDLSAYVQALTELGYVCEDLLDTEGYVDCVSPTSTLEIVLFDLTPYGYPEGSFEFQLILIEPPAPEFPAEDVAEFVGDYTTDTVPAAEGTAFETFTSQGSFIINVTGGTWVSYSETLAQTGYTIHEAFGDGMYVATSPSGALDITVFEEEGMIQIQVAKVVAPTLTAFPSDNVDAFLSGATPETLPVPTAGGFDDKGVITSSSSYYEVIVRYADVFAYAEALQDAGWSINTSYYSYYGVIQAFSPLGSITLQLWDNGVSFDLDAYINGEAYSEWPTAKVAAMCEGNTEVEIPAAEGSGFSVTKNDGSSFYFGVIKVAGADVEDYLAVLESNGFEYYYDTDYSCYTAFKGDLAIDIYDYPTYMGLGFYTYVAPAAEWPAETIAELLEGKTEVTIPEAEGTSFTVEPLTSFYFGSITISGGDMEAYLLTLESAEFSVIWDSTYECYVAAKDNLLMDIGENPNVEGEFQMLLYLKAAFPTEDVAEAVQLLVPGSETVVPEIEAEEYQLQDARAYIGGFVLYAAGDSSLLNEYTGILDEAGWAVSELEEGLYGAVSPAEDIMLQVSYDDYYKELDICILTYTKPATEWPADEVAALVESIEAEGSVPACNGLSFTLYEAEGWFPAQINVGVEEGTAEAAAAAYVAQLKEAGFFLVSSQYGYDYYAEEGSTLALCVYEYDDSTFIIELACLYEPAVKPMTDWPADEVASIIEGIGAEGSAVPEFEGEGISFNLGSYYVVVNHGANDPEDLVAGYREKLEGLGYFVAGDNYGDPIYALEGETLGISPYYYNGSICIEFMELAEPAVKPVPAEFPTEAVEAFFNGKTDEVVPEMVAYDFEASDKTSYLEIKAEGGNVKDYMKVLSDAGWTADYDSSAYYNYATSPEGSIKMTLINYTSYVTLKLEYVPPKLTEFPADAIAEALGEKAKTTLPGITGEGLQFEFTDNGDNSMKLDVYGSTPAEYVSTLEKAGFTVTEGSEGDQYWYLLSADKTVKVQVYDYMSAGQDYFRVKAYGQDPTWTVTSFDASVVEQALGLEANFIPAIADGTKFSLTQTSDSSIKVTVESGANYSNFIAALTEAGFEETSAGSNVFVKENVTAVVSILNPITQKYSVEYTVQSSPAPEGEWPLEQIAALLGDTRAAYLPEAEGATSVTVTGSKGDCTISITGVSAVAYKQALLDAGFYFDGMSYSKSDLYVDVTGSGDSCTVNAYYFDF